MISQTICGPPLPLLDDLARVDLRQLRPLLGHPDQLVRLSHRDTLGQPRVIMVSPGRDEVLAWYEEEPHLLALEWSPCRFGGSRPWFRCACCEGRALVLYASSSCFRCRRCTRAGYAVWKESSEDRALRKVRKLRSRVGNPKGTVSAWTRPKGMHGTTFGRILHRATEAESSFYATMPGVLARLQAQVGSLEASEGADRRFPRFPL